MAEGEPGGPDPLNARQSIMKTFLWIAGLAGLLTTMGCVVNEPPPSGGYYGRTEYHSARHYSLPKQYYWRDGYFDAVGQYHYYKW